MSELKKGDKVSVPLGTGYISKIDESKVHTVEIEQYNGIEYLGKFIGVHESNIQKIKDDNTKK